MPWNSSSLVTRRAWCVIVIVANALILLPELVLTQVVIRDTVFIGHGNPQRHPASSYSSYTTTSYFVAPQSGRLGIMPHFVFTIGSQVPTTSYLAVQLPDTTITEEVLPYLPAHFSDQWSFDSCNIIVNTFFDSYQWWPWNVPADTFYTTRVTVGDTVRFTFYGQHTNFVTCISGPREEDRNCHGPSTISGEPLWDAALEAPRSCAGDPLPPERFWFFFFFEDTLVRFVTPDTAVYPTYAGHNNTLATRNYLDIELQVENAGVPIPNYWVRIDTPKVRNLFSADSGGHSHSHTSPRRPVGTYRYQDTTTQRQSILAQTDSTGKIKFRYLASQFGGVERIRARSVSDTTKLDTLSIKTRVPGLELLPAGANYDKIGGTCKHHGPDDDAPSECQTPDNDHWGTPNVVTNIQNIAAAYAEQFPNEQRIKFNDMSLPLGGRFDIDTLWVGNSNHQYHRLGTDVDVRSTTIPDDDRYSDTNRNGRYDSGEPITFDLNSNRQYDRTNTAFETICRRNNVLRARLEHPGVPRREHYHLYFQQYWR